MCMPMETDTAVDQLEVRMCDCCIQQVCVDVVARARMDHEHLVLDVAVGQSAQPTEALFAYDVDCPADHRGRVLIEPLEYFGVGACAVMVANESQPSSMHDLVDAPFRIAAVPHHVA